MSPPADHPHPEPGRRSELLRLFATLGMIGFGGPAAHIALMRREAVDGRGWMCDREVMDLVLLMGVGAVTGLAATAAGIGP